MVLALMIGLFVGFIIGYGRGIYCCDEELVAMNYSQKQRGDYWFACYQELLNEGWDRVSAEDAS